MRSILIVGKGPSAEQAQYAQRVGEPVAVINDAMKLVNGEVQFCFFTDLEQLEACRQHANRVRSWVCPSKLHRDCQPCDEPLPLWLTGCDEIHRYPYRTCNPDEFQSLVRARAICHRSTATAAMSWLAYAGFDTLRLIGFDGGTAYADGVNPGLPAGFNCDVFKAAQIELARVLKNAMGVETEWLC